LKSRQYETREGEKRTVFEIEVEEVGPSLKYATAKVTRAQRSSGGGGYGNQGGGGGGYSGGGAPASDPWASSAPADSGQGGSGGGAPAGDPWGAPGVGGNDEPPF
jgi:single-strand DNA-binding protein